MDLIALLKALDMLLTLATKAGANIAEFQAMRAQAEAEGRELTDEELQGLSNKAHEAVERL